MTEYQKLLDNFNIAAADLVDATSPDSIRQITEQFMYWMQLLQAKEAA